MELGKNKGYIVDYGTTKTKSGGLQVFIKFMVGQEESTWYGSPYRKDSDEVNDIAMMQLVQCGFDPSVNELDKLSAGVDSKILITNEEIDIYVADEIAPDGSTKRRIKTIGDIGPNRISTAEASQLVSDAKKQKLKEAAAKFKVRKKKDPNEPAPF